ncbi:MAG: hypothetical protein FWE54_02675 [Methanimicrococcus sp.]|nr:hypothetical protein [Methanimicrococcus sp.]
MESKKALFAVAAVAAVFVVMISAAAFSGFLNGNDNGDHNHDAPANATAPVTAAGNSGNSGNQSNSGNSGNQNNAGNQSNSGSPGNPSGPSTQAGSGGHVHGDDCDCGDDHGNTIVAGGGSGGSGGSGGQKPAPTPETDELKWLIAQLENPDVTAIVIKLDILLQDGAEYDFTGKTFTSDGGVLIIPSGAEVTVTGSEGWGAAAVSRYLRGEDSTSWLHRPDSSANPDVTRRFWDSYSANPHWCAPFVHGLTTISVKNEGQLRAALASTSASKERIVLRDAIELVDGAAYDFTGITFVFAAGEYSICNAGSVVHTSDGGVLIVPSGAEVTVTGSEGWGTSAVSRYLRGEDSTSWLHRPDSNTNPDVTRRFWDAYSGNPHWCAPFVHELTTISVKNEGQLRAALASTSASKDRIVLLGDIELVEGTVYDFTGITFISEAGEYSICNAGSVVHTSNGGALIFPPA